MKEIAILDINAGTVDIHTLPQHVKTDHDIEDYVYLTLDMDNDCQWITAEKITIHDFRNK